LSPTVDFLCTGFSDVKKWRNLIIFPELLIGFMRIIDFSPAPPFLPISLPHTGPETLPECEYEALFSGEGIANLVLRR
jgi:hypothetical protein